MNALNRLIPAQDGPGKFAMLYVLENDRPAEIHARWGLRPSSPDQRPYTLLRLENQPRIERPALIIAQDFIVDQGEGSRKVRHRVQLLTDQTFFCIAGLWRPETSDWPMSFAAITVPASPDIAPLKDRHMAPVRPEDWEAWLRQSRRPEEILRPFPRGSFRITGPRKGAVGDLFDI